MQLIQYRNDLKERARQLRNNSTLSEILLWKYLKGKQILGVDFNRQKPIGIYIIDFYNSKHRLGIEIDGSSHIGKENYDFRRDKQLRQLGLRMLYIDDRDVKRDIAGVVQIIEAWVRTHTQVKHL